MPSTFTWIDHAERDRERMMELIDRFAEQDTRDELGIGGVRDSLAEQLFPGVSVVQTRAQYLLFVPWMYRELERAGTPASDSTRRARRAEIALINALAAAPENTGTIGIQARDALKRLPSNVYWQALGRYGIRLFPGRQDLYHRSFDLFHTRTERHRTLGRERADETADAPPANWHPQLPSPPDDFPAPADFLLRPQDADYLRERIMATAPGTLLAFLVDHGRATERTAFPWEHPQVGELPDRLRDLLTHARCFSEVMHGAALLYNLILAEEATRAEAEEYRERLKTWAETILERSGDLGVWDRDNFWQRVSSGPTRITPQARAFANRWLDIALAPGGVAGVADAAPVRDLIRARERELKGPLARLGNLRAQERWNGASGASQLSYRWNTAQTLVTDILTGLAGEEADA